MAVSEPRLGHVSQARLQQPGSAAARRDSAAAAEAGVLGLPFGEQPTQEQVLPPQEVAPADDFLVAAGLGGRRQQDTQDLGDCQDLLASLSSRVVQARRQSSRLRQAWPRKESARASREREGEPQQPDVQRQQHPAAAANRRGTEQQREKQQEEQHAGDTEQQQEHELRQQGWMQPPPNVDSSLPLPRALGLSEAEVARHQHRRMKLQARGHSAPACSRCRACRASSRSEYSGQPKEAELPCLANQALQAWERQLGPVTVAAVMEAVHQLYGEQPGQASCGMCCACQQQAWAARSSKKRQRREKAEGQQEKQETQGEGVYEEERERGSSGCQTVAALSSERLPQRLLPGAVLAGWVPKQGPKQSGVQALQQLLLSLYTVGEPRQAHPAPQGGSGSSDADEDDVGGGSGAGRSSDDDNNRWLAWVHHSRRQQRTTAPGTGQRHGQQCLLSASCILGAGHAQRCILIKESKLAQHLREAVQTLRVSVQQLMGPWICPNKLPAGMAGQQHGEEEGGSWGEPIGTQAPPGSEPPHVCRALNHLPAHCFNCGQCGAPRWGGPLGEAQRRVAAALQQAGGLRSVGGPTSIAARIAWEGGTAAELLPGLERPEELGHLEAEEQAVTELVVRAREALRTGPEPPSPETVRACREQRQSLLGRAATALEIAAMRVTEEQQALDSVLALHQAIQTALAAVEQHQGEGLPWWWPEEGVVLATAEPAAAGMPYGGGALGASALAPATLAGLHRQVQPPQRPRQRHPAPERPAGAVAARQLEAAKAAAAALLADAHQEAAALADGPQAEGRLRHQQQVLSHDAFCRDVRRALESSGLAAAAEEEEEEEDGRGGAAHGLCTSLYYWGGSGGVGRRTSPYALLWGWTPGAVGRLRRILKAHPELAALLREQLLGQELPQQQQLVQAQGRAEAPSGAAGGLPPLAALLFPPLPAGWQPGPGVHGRLPVPGGLPPPRGAQGGSQQRQHQEEGVQVQVEEGGQQLEAEHPLTHFLRQQEQLQRRQEQDRLEYAARLQRQRGGSLAGRRWGAPPSQQQGHPGSELGLLAVQPSREQAEAEQQAAEEEWAAVRASKEVQTRVESSRSQPEVAIQETGEEVEQGQQEQQREQQAAKGGRAAVTPRQAPSTVSHSSASPTSSVQQQQQQELEPAAAVAVESQAESVLAGQDAGGGQQHPPRQQQQQPAVAPAPKRERQKDEEMEEGLASQSGQMDSRPAGQEEGGGAAEGAGETEGRGEAGQGHPEQEQEGGAPWELPPTQASQHDPSEQPVDTAALLRQRLLERERLRRRRAEVAERQRRMEERRRQLEQEAAQKQEAEAREVKEKTIVRWQMEQEAERQREGWQQGATSAVLHFAWRLLGDVLRRQLEQCYRQQLLWLSASAMERVLTPIEKQAAAGAAAAQLQLLPPLPPALHQAVKAALVAPEDRPPVSLMAPPRPPPAVGQGPWQEGEAAQDLVSNLWVEAADEKEDIGQQEVGAVQQQQQHEQWQTHAGHLPDGLEVDWQQQQQRQQQASTGSDRGTVSTGYDGGMSRTSGGSSPAGRTVGAGSSPESRPSLGAAAASGAASDTSTSAATIPGGAGWQPLQEEEEEGVEGQTGQQQEALQQEDAAIGSGGGRGRAGGKPARLERQWPPLPQGRSGLGWRWIPARRRQRQRLLLDPTRHPALVEALPGGGALPVHTAQALVPGGVKQQMAVANKLAAWRRRRWQEAQQAQWGSALADSGRKLRRESWRQANEEEGEQADDEGPEWGGAPMDAASPAAPWGDGQPARVRRRQGGWTEEELSQRQLSNPLLQDPRLLPLVVHPSLRACGHCRACRRHRSQAGTLLKCAIHERLRLMHWNMVGQAQEAGPAATPTWEGGPAGPQAERGIGIPLLCGEAGVPALDVLRVAVALRQQHPDWPVAFLTPGRVDAVAAALPALAAAATEQARRMPLRQRKLLLSVALRTQRLYGVTPQAAAAVAEAQALVAAAEAAEASDGDRGGCIGGSISTSSMASSDSSRGSGGSMDGWSEAPSQLPGSQLPEPQVSQPEVPGSQVQGPRVAESVLGGAGGSHSRGSQASRKRRRGAGSSTLSEAAKEARAKRWRKAEGQQQQAFFHAAGGSAFARPHALANAPQQAASSGQQPAAAAPARAHSGGEGAAEPQPPPAEQQHVGSAALQASRGAAGQGVPPPPGAAQEEDQAATATPLRAAQDQAATATHLRTMLNAAEDHAATAALRAVASQLRQLGDPDVVLAFEAALAAGMRPAAVAAALCRYQALLGSDPWGGVRAADVRGWAAQRGAARRKQERRPATGAVAMGAAGAGTGPPAEAGAAEAQDTESEVPPEGPVLSSEESSDGGVSDQSTTPESEVGRSREAEEDGEEEVVQQLGREEQGEEAQQVEQQQGMEMAQEERPWELGAQAWGAPAGGGGWVGEQPPEGQGDGQGGWTGGGQAEVEHATAEPGGGWAWPWGGQPRSDDW